MVAKKLTKYFFGLLLILGIGLLVCYGPKTIASKTYDSYYNQCDYSQSTYGGTESCNPEDVGTVTVTNDTSSQSPPSTHSTQQTQKTYLLFATVGLLISIISFCGMYYFMRQQKRDQRFGLVINNEQLHSSIG